MSDLGWTQIFATIPALATVVAVREEARHMSFLLSKGAGVPGKPTIKLGNVGLVSAWRSAYARSRKAEPHEYSVWAPVRCELAHIP